MNRMVLLVMVALSLGLIWISYSAVCAMPTPEVLGREVDGIKVSLRLNKTRFVNGEPIVVDLEIANVLRVGAGEGYDTYIPWVLSRPSRMYEIHAVDEDGKDQVICGGTGKDVSVEVLHLPPGHFCGYRLTCGSKGYGGHADIEPGRYQVYGVFKNSRVKLPGPGVSIDIRGLTTEERKKLGEDLGKELKRIERENQKLGENSLWVGQLFSESVTIEVVQQ
ncbi:MAG: hypothetical protein ACYTEO_07935 [Planctomycetota bacterium]